MDGGNRGELSPSIIPKITNRNNATIKKEKRYRKIRPREGLNKWEDKVKDRNSEGTVWRNPRKLHANRRKGVQPGTGRSTKV